MSFPVVGQLGIYPEYEPWNATHMEQALRDGKWFWLYAPDLAEQNQPIAVYEESEFRVYTNANKELCVFATTSFLEFAAWCAFWGCEYT